MKSLDGWKSIEVSPRTTAIAILSLLALCAVVILTIRSMLIRTPQAPGRTPGLHQEGRSVSSSLAEGSSMRKDWRVSTGSADYAVIVERNIFRTPADPTKATSVPSPANTGKTALLSLPSLPLPALPSSVMAEKPQEDVAGNTRRNIAFTGVVERTGVRQALLENMATGESRFVSLDEEAFGLRLVQLEERQVVLEKNGTQVRLGLGENKTDSLTAAAMPSSTVSLGSVSPSGAAGMPAWGAGFGIGRDSGRFSNFRRRRDRSSEESGSAAPGSVGSVRPTTPAAGNAGLTTPAAGKAAGGTER